MNDFTKEELNLIMDGMNHWLMNDFSILGEKVLNKIQAMIDNYCEHELERYEMGQGAILSMGICKHCGKGMK